MHAARPANLRSCYTTCCCCVTNATHPNHVCCAGVLFVRHELPQLTDVLGPATNISLQLEERALSAAERLQRVRRQGQDLRQLGLTDKEAANQKLQATLQRTLAVCPSLLVAHPHHTTVVQVGGGKCAVHCCHDAGGWM